MVSDDEAEEGADWPNKCLFTLVLKSPETLIRSSVIHSLQVQLTMEQNDIEHLYIKPDVSAFKLEPMESQDGVESLMVQQFEENSTINIKIEFEHINKESNIETDTATKHDKVQDMNRLEFTGKVYENGKKNRIKCPQCDNTLKNRANLKQHLKYVHSSEADVVECNQCYRTFKSLAHLRSHVSAVHFDVNEVKCNICDKTFASKKKLNNHRFYSHPEPEESVSCDVCNKTFKSKYNLKIHIRTVHPSEDRSVRCPHCDKNFKSNMLLQRHIKWSHPTDGMMYRCQECSRVLPSIACYRKHMQNVHLNTDNTNCDICFKSFKTSKNLQRHIKTLHSNERHESKKYKTGDIQCTECDRKFSTNTALFWHFERIHSDSKQNNFCTLCIKEFSDAGSLLRHFKTAHSEESVNCDLCNKTFKSSISLQRHLRVTHAPAEAAQDCEICHKTFKCAIHLRIHMNAVHSKESPYSCDICNKIFSSKKYMVKHRKIHVSTKEFSCQICLKLFKSPNDVRKHTKRVHMKINCENSVVSSHEEVESSVKCESDNFPMSSSYTSEELDLDATNYHNRDEILLSNIKVEID